MDTMFFKKFLLWIQCFLKSFSDFYYKKVENKTGILQRVIN